MNWWWVGILVVAAWAVGVVVGWCLRQPTIYGRSYGSVLTEVWRWFWGMPRPTATTAGFTLPAIDRLRCTEMEVARLTVTERMFLQGSGGECEIVSDPEGIRLTLRNPAVFRNGIHVVLKPSGESNMSALGPDGEVAAALDVAPDGAVLNRIPPPPPPEPVVIT